MYAVKKTSDYPAISRVNKVIQGLKFNLVRRKISASPFLMFLDLQKTRAERISCRKLLKAGAMIVSHSMRKLMK
ncbi:hypothetical protein AQUCO_00500114v1 [Aquilegia coerulea]|uniref:Uncharacterized protein n=1 Tax=Aquilegia coerulea TaxID=218851 RepID=A0A2G5EQC0_AQUCA|nr:hypothetical protein AQUCO_00500114v1 [Aquilegia coerulea]